MKFNYDDLWEEDEDRDSEKKIKELPAGLPRKGLKGKYLKVKGRVTKKQIRMSYSRNLKVMRDDE